VDAYLAQMAFVQSAGADVILMASRALAAAARGPGDYLSVYGSLLEQAGRPVILHWLGEVFDPALRRRLPAGVRLYTGDDFGYASLIRGDESGHSDALLGALAPAG
jgi:hypothetical protein